ncbi:MAG: hypothetical protein AAF264_01215 [Pseudomonadota bacterium]
MITTLPDADFSSSRAPRARPLRYGFDVTGLKGLWLFEDGDIDQPHVGPFQDYSGLGSDLTLYTGRTAPIRRSYGLEVADVDGLILESAISSGLAEFTMLAAVKPRLPGDEAGVYQTIFGSTDTPLPPADTGRHDHQTFPVINFDGTSPAASAEWAVFDYSGDVFGSVRPVVDGGSAGGSLNDAVVLDFAVSASADTARIGTHLSTPRTFTSQALGDYYSQSRSGVLTFGAWPEGFSRTVASPQAELYGFALYDRYLDAEALTYARAAMTARIEARGVTLAT